MRIELILVRDPDGGTDTELFLDGQRETHYDCYNIDAGRGYVWDDWTEHRDWCLAAASSDTVRDALADAFTDPPGSSYIDGRDDQCWLPDPLLGDHDTTGPARDTDRSDRPSGHDHALDTLLRVYHGDATVALLDLARRAGIAVHYLDRAALEAAIDRVFTDDEWQRARPLLDGYDEWLEGSGAAESVTYWAQNVLPRLARIPTETDADRAVPDSPRLGTRP